jgi:hypothetical protein
MRKLLQLGAALALSISAASQTGTQIYSPVEVDCTTKLVPSTGSTSALTEAFYGSSSSDWYDAQVIAQFNSIPHRVIEDCERIGVLAFHGSGSTESVLDRGIKYVDFQVDTYDTLRVWHESWNTNSDTVEFFCTIKPANFSDGEHTLRAEVVPWIGESRVLEWDFVTDDGGTAPISTTTYYVDAVNGSDSNDGSSWANAKKTWESAYNHSRVNNADHAKGGTKYLLEEGTYQDFAGPSSGPYADNSGGTWDVIEAAPGVNPEDVIIDKITGDKTRTRLLCFRGVQIRANLNIYSESSFDDPRVWLDGCQMQGTDKAPANTTDWTTVYTSLDSPVSSAGSTNSGSLKFFAFGCDAYWHDNTYKKFAMILESVSRDSVGDFLSKTSLVRNVHVHDQWDHDTAQHTDLMQISPASSAGDDIDLNMILYGMYAHDNQAQGIFIGANTSSSGNMHNLALVNCIIESEDQNSQIQKPMYHLVLLHNTWADQKFVWRCDYAADWYVVGNIFHNFDTSSGGTATVCDDGDGTEGDETQSDVDAIGFFAYNHCTNTATGLILDSVNSPQAWESTGDPEFLNEVAIGVAGDDDFNIDTTSPAGGIVAAVDAVIEKRDQEEQIRDTTATAAGALLQKNE